MVFMSPMPSENDLEIYNANYFQAAHGGHPTNKSAVGFFSGISKLRGIYVSSFLKKKLLFPKKVLEVGPGHGYFAKNWISNNPDVQYFGVETDESCYESLKHAGVKIVLPSQVQAEIDCVDLVIISHVLEHISNPDLFLQQVTQKLKTGGVLFIEVPCFDWMHKEIYEPHLLFFDKVPMAKLLERNGFKQLEVNYYGNTIQYLTKPKSKSIHFFEKVRSKLIDFGFYHFFAYQDMDDLKSLTPLERAATKNAMAHKESEVPAWWLRAVSIKS